MVRNSLVLIRGPAERQRTLSVIQLYFTIMILNITKKLLISTFGNTCWTFKTTELVFVVYVHLEYDKMKHTGTDAGIYLSLMKCQT